VPFVSAVVYDTFRSRAANPLPARLYVTHFTLAERICLGKCLTHGLKEWLKRFDSRYSPTNFCSFLVSAGACLGGDLWLHAA